MTTDISSLNPNLHKMSEGAVGFDGSENNPITGAPVRPPVAIPEETDDDELDLIKLSPDAKRRMVLLKEQAGQPLTGELLRTKLAMQAWRHYFKTGEKIQL